MLGETLSQILNQTPSHISSQILRQTLSQNLSQTKNIIKESTVSTLKCMKTYNLVFVKTVLIRWWW